MQSLISTANTTSTILAANGQIPVGTVTHKKGCRFDASNNGGISIVCNGHYFGVVSVTLQATAATSVTVQLNNNGNPVAAASASTTFAAIGDIATVTIPIVGFASSMCRCSSPDILTLTVNAAVQVNSVDLVLED